MASSFGKNVITTIYGSSHGPNVGVKIQGIEKGLSIDLDLLQEFLDRRAPGQNQLSTGRREADKVKILSGIEKGITTGEVIEAIIENTDVRRKDYEKFKDIPRPGHADYTAALKYGQDHDMSGGGAFSGRMTAPLCIAGGIFEQLLGQKGIFVGAHIYNIYNIFDRPFDGAQDEVALREATGKAFPVMDEVSGEKMKEKILKAKEEGDSLGGSIECVVLGMPGGIGGPLFDGLEGAMAGALFGIPAVKGVEFGSGFGACQMKGSQNNDEYILEEDKIRTLTNNHGGILGGISSAMPIVVRVAFKPTPSIAKPQRSVNLKTRKEEIIKIEGRHDPCIVPRAVAPVEAAVAMAIYDMMT